MVENAIRPFVVGRKNWLFAGSPDGALASATFFTLIETAKANGLDPYGYLRYVFKKFLWSKPSKISKTCCPKISVPRTLLFRLKTDSGPLVFPSILT